MATLEDVSKWWSNTFSNFGSGLDNLWNSITGKTSKEIAEKNFNLQQQMFDYQKQLNQTQMEREDTAYQRAVKDANAAGISSLSVGNGANSTTGTTVEAPQINDYASDNFSKGMNLLNTITQFQNNLTQQIISKRKADADIGKTNAETADIEAHTDLFNYTISGKKDLFDHDYADKITKYDFYKNKGLFSGADPYEKFAILNDYTGKQYSDLIQTNQFSNLGLIFGLLSKIGNKLTDGKIESVDDLLDYAGNALKDNLPQVINGKIQLDPGVTKYLISHPFKNKEDKKSDQNATNTQNSLNDIRYRDNHKASKKQNKKGKF